MYEDFNQMATCWNANCYSHFWIRIIYIPISQLAFDEVYEEDDTSGKRTQ